MVLVSRRTPTRSPLVNVWGLVGAPRSVRGPRRLSVLRKRKVLPKCSGQASALVSVPGSAKVKVALALAKEAQAPARVRRAAS